MGVKTLRCRSHNCIGTRGGSKRLYVTGSTLGGTPPPPPPPPRLPPRGIGGDRAEPLRANGARVVGRSRRSGAVGSFFSKNSYFYLSPTTIDWWSSVASRSFPCRWSVGGSSASSADVDGPGLRTGVLRRRRRRRNSSISVSWPLRSHSFICRYSSIASTRPSPCAGRS